MTEKVRCALCGYEFTPEEAERACRSCPLAPRCGLVRCPRCGYEMLPEARLVTWVRRLRDRVRKTSVPRKDY